ncbi:MAG: hypothetical protein IPK76_21080 [Lewinellaceae bacterium]|nr:hypothetical protein [Lewinellaceae bacterium]
METIKFIVNVFYLYLLAGVIFAALFIWRGAAKLDESAKGISWKTRALLFPAGAALWPVLLRKWLQISRAHSTDE